MTSKGESPRERHAHAHAYATDSPPPASLTPQDATRADDTTYGGITATPTDTSKPPLKRPQAAVPTPDRYNLPADWDSKSKCQRTNNEKSAEGDGGGSWH
jgi:hypothetical protein